MPTEDDMQKANDMLQLVRNQCTGAQNEVVQVGAELLAERRKVAALEAEIAELKNDQGGKPEPDVIDHVPVIPNGHAPEARAN